MLFLSRLRRKGCSCLGRDPVQFIMCNEPGHQQRSGMAMYLGRFIATAPSVVPVSCSCLLHAEHQARSTPPSLVPVCVVESRPEAAARLALSTPTKVDHRSAGTVSLRWGKWHFRFFYTSLARSLFAFLCSTWIRCCATNEAHVRLTPPLHSAYRREALGPDWGIFCLWKMPVS